jgi:cytochrome c-type biogenesis protein CcmH
VCSSDLAAAVAPAASAVQGRVTLAAGLRARVSPDDTLYVFARPAEGARMPLAILRKQVKDLPLDFTLDDSLAMSPAARLSGTPRVVVGARISKSGNAMPQPGDLQGLSAPVPVGSRGISLEISDVLP